VSTSGDTIEPQAAPGDDHPVPERTDVPQRTGPRFARLRRVAATLSTAGLVVALLFFWWSMTPSLLPRPWYLQGVATGICTALGYGVGTTLAWLARRLGIAAVRSPAARRRVRRVLVYAAPVVVAVALVLGAYWQSVTRELVGIDTGDRNFYGLVLLIAVAVAALLIGIARGLRSAARALGRFGSRFVPAPVARAGGVLVVAVLVVMLIHGALYDGLLGAAEGTFATVDEGTNPGVVRPVDAERSGSPASPVPWETLGSEGRTFVAGGPTADELSAFGGAPAVTPIRVYAGRQSADSMREVAGLVVDELERTGAFDRAVLAVATTTGRGWVNARVAGSLEYMYGGDTAIAAMQYSFLPSPLAFIADRETPRLAGRELFEQVYAAWSSRPEGSRPQLVVFGESLGSYGGQDAFAGLQDMLTRTQGALWVGTPNFTEQWAEVTANRDEGSPERRPIVDGGDRARFLDQPEDLALPGAWGRPRVVYLQHATDPITWWSTDLILRRPDWLAEPLGPGVNPTMRWIPLVTFWQVTVDMVFAADVPPGRGHNFGPDAVDAWAGIVEPPGWSAAETERLREVIGREGP
jgi:uncharacterized membrane protein